MDVPELLHPHYPVGSAPYCMHATVPTGRKLFEIARESHTIEAMIHGYHEIWCADVGEELSCMKKVENYCDSFAVAVVRSIDQSMATPPASCVCGVARTYV